MVRSIIRNPGRPVASGAPDARDALIDTAARLFAAQGFEATSLREVADGARVTPAMVAYYFRTKAGLLEAVVVDGLETMIEVVERTVTEYQPGRFIEHLVSNYVNTLTATPWIPQIMMREVVSRDTPLRSLFVDEFAKRAVELVPGVVLEEIRLGRLRGDLDPRFLVLSLVGMCLFPFIVQPVLGGLLEFELDEAFGCAYSEHVISLFLLGASGDADEASRAAAADSGGAP